MSARMQVTTRRTTLIAVVVTATVAALVLAIVLWRAHPTSSAAPATQAARVTPNPATPHRDAAPAVPSSDDPVTFARSVATTLFAWDTSDRRPVEAYRDPIIDIADPAGVETPGLVADLAMYLPTAETWEFLAGYSTRQWLDITAAVVPTAWPGIVANAPQGSLADGTTAVTIDGVRHRAGEWEGEAVHDRFTVAFTVFVVCGPTYPTCHLLRLSALDTPMR